MSIFLLIVTFYLDKQKNFGEPLLQDQVNGLKESAAMLYKLNRESWKDCKTFRIQARKTFGFDDLYQQRLKKQANEQIKKEDEATILHAYSILKIFSKYETLPPMREQLDLVHRNLRPHLQQFVKRSQYNSAEELIKLFKDIERAEKTKRKRNQPADKNTMKISAANPF